MKFLRHTLSAITLGAALLSSACAGDNSGNNSQNVTDTAADPFMEKTPVAPGEFAITRGSDGQWYFNAIGARGDILLISEGYVERPSALNGVLSVEENGVLLERYQISETADGDFNFVLRAGNNQVIADSQLFRSLEEAQAGVEAARELVAGILQYKAAMTQGARFDLWRDKSDNEWHFVMRADDGRILLESEGYQGRTGAVNGIESVRLNGKDLGRYQVLDGGGELYFILKAANGQEIAVSDSFPTAVEVEASITETNQLLISERVANPW
jgi:hypothetical protein